MTLKQNNPKESIAIFAHGLGGDADQRIYYHDTIGCPIVGQNGPEWDRTKYGHNIGPQQSCLAQEDDIFVITKQIKKYTQENKNIILFGVSKGAATMINTIAWLATHNPDLLKNINAVILESPFASVEKVVARIVGINFDEQTKHTNKSIAHEYFPNYNPENITPIKSVTSMWDTVNRNLVIVFVHSKQDKLIDITDSQLLHGTLKQKNFKNLYLIEAQTGQHANIFWGPDRKHILEKLHEIYRKHNLPIQPGPKQS